MRRRVPWKQSTRWCTVRSLACRTAGRWSRSIRQRTCAGSCGSQPRCCPRASRCCPSASATSRRPLPRWLCAPRCRGSRPATSPLCSGCTPLCPKWPAGARAPSGQPSSAGSSWGCACARLARSGAPHSHWASRPPPRISTRAARYRRARTSSPSGCTRRARSGPSRPGRTHARLRCSAAASTSLGSRMRTPCARCSPAPS
mmetsp:Transcript_37254/g.92733  ORF Transcript_37254/g.92733 Transcript_37254/m.92733 type:complete len:201 (+) Transcript_37254:960-1562(+)